ncbi:MAG: hypothetical protein ACFFKA_01915 [Candidatus Thorarchaeota archaeon]
MKKNKDEREKILKNYVKPDIIVQYLFIERAEKQIKPINDDQGYQMGYFNILISGTFKNDNLLAFKTLLLDELKFSVKEYEVFKAESINLNEYKFGLVDNDRNIKEFNDMDESFFKALIDSLRNLIIVGNNFDVEKFKTHEIFNRWFDEFTNRF